MATAKANHLPAPPLHFIRPALVEAKLMTPKQARDAVYVATVAEELRSIEEMISALEGNLHLGAVADIEITSPDLGCGTPSDPDAHWIRAKSCELDRRLRRIEHWPGRPLRELE
jgi:hypothetical protein